MSADIFPENPTFARIKRPSAPKLAGASSRDSTSRQYVLHPTVELSRKPRDAADLLAKIDALDHELTLPYYVKKGKRKQNKRTSNRPMWAFVLGLGLVVVGSACWYYLSQTESGAARSLPEKASPSIAAPQNPEVAPLPPMVTVIAPSEEPNNIHIMRSRAQRESEQQREVRKAKAEAQRIRQENERTTRQTEERLRAERVAPELIEEGRQAPTQPVLAPVPAPELCANRSNFIARGFCEARACTLEQWRDHPICIKRHESEQRNVFPFSGGG